jgi:phosphohistidine phosphatase
MALYLVQHGKSLPKDLDPERNLSEEGVSEVERIAILAREYGIKISHIQHSGKKRAIQTAEIITSVLNPEGGIREREGLNPMDDVVPIADGIEGGENLMLVGHLPFMERLTSYLITGTIERPVFKFQNGGILCLHRDPGLDSWVIRWALLPNID